MLPLAGASSSYQYDDATTISSTSTNTTTTSTSSEEESLLYSFPPTATAAVAIFKQHHQHQHQRIHDYNNNNNNNCRRPPNHNHLTITKIALLEQKLADALRENERLTQTLKEKEEYCQCCQQRRPNDDDGDDDDDGVENGKGASTKIRSKNNNSTATISSSIQSSSTFDVQGTIEEIQRFLFLDGRHISDGKTMVGTYSQKLVSLGIPLDRLFVGGFGKHPTAMAYNWKWESNSSNNDNDNNNNINNDNNNNVVERRVPKIILDELINSNEPFAQMYHGKTKRIRILPGEGIPYDSKWYEEENYQDYLALEMTYKNKFFGGIAWGTKRIGGFTTDHIHVLEELQNEFSTIMAHHIHDLANQDLCQVLEEEVEDRTKKLALTNQSLEEMNHRVIIQSKAQLRHFAMMSHEIRTPLNCIVGMSNLLLSGLPTKKKITTTTTSASDNEDDNDNCVNTTTTEDEIQDSIRMIVESGDLLSAVVNDVLDYSRLESGNVDIEMKQIDLLPTLSTVIDTIRCKGNERNVTVNTYWCPTNVPKYIHSDGRRLQQILYNLMGNALKFSHPNSHIDLTVSVKTIQKKVVVDDDDDDDQHHHQGTTTTTTTTTTIPSSPSTTTTTTSNSNCTKLEYQDTLCFSVKDYGRGIRKDDLEKIFEPFVQASTTDTQHFYGGTGLGLAITSKLVKGLGGTIRADSEFGSWSEFVVELGINRNSNQSIQLHSQEDEEEDDTMTTPPPPTTTMGGVVETTLTAATTVQEPDEAVISRTNNTVVSVDKKSTITNETKKLNDFSRLKVLIAEDNVVNQKVLAGTLKRLGLIDITIVDNGQKAVDAAKEFAFDVIFMDMQMPIMDGLEACRQIVQMKMMTNDEQQQQQRPPPPPPKIVFVTAHALTTFQTQAEAVGGSGFISKPFHLKKIEAMLQTL